MAKLNKWQRELIKLEKQAGKDLSKELRDAYNDILKDVRQRLKHYLEEFETLPYYRQVQTAGLEELQNEIIALLGDTLPVNHAKISAFKQDEMIDGYLSNIYLINSKTGVIPSNLTLSKDVIRQSVEAPVAGKRLSQRLYENRELLARDVTNILRSGISMGDSYQKMARNITRRTEADYRKALTIARTEAKQLRSKANEQSYQEAKAMGIGIEKVWRSSLDNRTRSTHRALDGQREDEEGYFTSPSGHKTKQPGLFSVASEDINCRCYVVEEIEGIAPNVRIDTFGREVSYGTTYNEWKENLIKDQGLDWWTSYEQLGRSNVRRPA